LRNLKNLKIQVFDFFGFLTFWDFSVFEISQLHEYIIAGILESVKGGLPVPEVSFEFSTACGKTCGKLSGGVLEWYR